jgi:hypothetical protein
MHSRRVEWAVGTALAALSLALRAVAFFHYRFDSDEPQHLHVTWGWTAGLLQYRDVFDNHAPLFHIVTAPLLAMVGERADAVIWMRAPMLVLFAVVIWATYDLGRRLYSPRVGAWAAVLLSLLPPFFLKSLEYRNDNLWMALVVAAFVVVSAGQSLLAGLLLGAALATSMKTTLVVLTIVIAGAITKRFIKFGAALLGFAIVPAIICAYFAARGAWPSLVYCVFTFNEAVETMRTPWQLWLPRAMWVPLMIAIVIRGRRSDADPMRRFFAVTIAVFFATLACFWVWISPRDYLPMLPLLMIFAVAAAKRVAILVAYAAVCVVLLFQSTNGFHDDARKEVTMMNQLLRLTRPGEPVMDYKGETVFRQRPYYFILEHITRNLILRGLVADTIPEDVVNARCYVAQADGEFWPDRGRAFLVQNFLDMGRLRAAGQRIGDDGAFSIAIPGDYVVIDKRGEAHGTLDGAPYIGARALAPGVHRFAGDGEPAAVLWAPAFRRGFSPFHLQDRDF